jgi:kynurenine 3-monooxygenase
MRPSHVVIAGSGLVGTLLATMLTRRGYRVTLYEKRPDLRRANLSAGKSINLALAERGMYGLRLAGLMDDVEPLLIPMRGRMVHGLDGTTEFFPYGQRPHEVIYSVSRGDLNRIMLDAVESTGSAKLHFQHEVRRANLDRRSLTLFDGATGREVTAEFEFVIGSDGSGSAIRKPLIAQTGGVETFEPLPHDYKELTIPAGPGGAYQLEREALHIWPRGGFMLIALPNLGGSFTVTLFLPRSGPVSFERLRTPNEVQGFFRKWFSSAEQYLPNLVEDFFGHPTGELGTLRCWPWTFGQSAMLIGDAAHAIVPFHGQGMNCGFEDCGVWLQLLERFGDDWSRAMREFETLRKPAADAIATMALENYIEMRDSVRDPRFQLKKELSFELERLFPARFIPRYSMVMFHRIPYHVALERGQVQERILEELTRGAASLAEIDVSRARARILSDLEPLGEDVIVGQFSQTPAAGSR